MLVPDVLVELICVVVQVLFSVTIRTVMRSRDASSPRRCVWSAISSPAPRRKGLSVIHPLFEFKDETQIHGPRCMRSSAAAAVLHCRRTIAAAPHCRTLQEDERRTRWDQNDIISNSQYRIYYISEQLYWEVQSYSRRRRALSSPRSCRWRCTPHAAWSATPPYRRP